MILRGKSFWMASVFIVCASMIASCAKAPLARVAPPSLNLPDEVTRPCEMAVLGDAPTLADLETAYMQRGLQIRACDVARALAVEVLLSERRMSQTLGRQD